MKKAYFKYLLSLLLFGSNGVIASRIGLTSYEIVLMRSMLGSALLIALFLLSGHRPGCMRNTRDTILIALSGLAMAADWLFVFEAYQQIGVSLGVLINYFGPVIVVALSPLLFNERVTCRKAAALAAALVGVFFISGQAAFDGASTWGLICAVLSALVFAAMIILNKMSKGIDGMENATLQMLFAFAAIAFFVGCKDGFNIEITDGEWLPVLWLGLLNTGGGCYLYFSSIGKLPVQTVAVCGYLEPLSSVLFAVFFLGERMSPLQIIGAFLIIGGAIFSKYKKKETFCC